MSECQLLHVPILAWSSPSEGLTWLRSPPAQHLWVQNGGEGLAQPTCELGLSAGMDLTADTPVPPWDTR